MKVGDISVPVFTNQTVYHPDYYSLIIENENKKGKVVTREVPVTKIIYDEYNLIKAVTPPVNPEVEPVGPGPSSFLVVSNSISESTTSM